MIYSAVSLFSGAGGLDYGFEVAGFETVAAVEMDPYCCQTIQVNRPDWGLIHDRIENVSTKKLFSVAGLKKRELDILYGGPPCQPFSKAGFWHSGDVQRLKDPRASTLRHYLRILEEMLPRTFLIENVSGFVFENKDEGLKLIQRRVRQINQRTGANYKVHWKILNAAEFGVPQIRERVFIVASRDGKDFEFPRPTHFDPLTPLGRKAIREGGLPFLTAWDALADLDEITDIPLAYQPRGRWANLLPTIPEGQNYLFHTERGEGVPIFKWRSRYWNFLLKLAKNRPSWTIQAQPGPAIGPFHWRNRKLTMRELARLQTFPDNVDILGTEREIQKQIGNAVPSAMGELLGKEIRRQFFGEKLPNRPLSLIPKKATLSQPRLRIKTLRGNDIRKMKDLNG